MADGGKGPLAPALIALLVGGAVAVAIGYAMTRGFDDAPTVVVTRTEPATAPASRLAVEPSSTTVPMAADADAPRGLSSILGPPREHNPTLCDESLWPRLETFVKELRGDEVMIDEAVWARQAASARTGVASWISKCRLDGRMVRLVGDESNRLLAEYDPADGYRAIDEPEPYDPERD